MVKVGRIGGFGRARDRDRPRLEQLQGCFALRGFDLRCGSEEGPLVLANAAGTVLVTADWSVGTLEIDGVRVAGRQDRTPDDNSYDMVSEVEYPLEPDLLLMQQVAFSGVRFVNVPRNDCFVTSPARLCWPRGNAQLAHPALIDPSDAWQWPWDPLWTRATMVEGLGDEWVVDLPPLLDSVALESVPAPPEAAQIVRDFELTAAKQGFVVERVPGPWSTWLVLRDGGYHGIADLVRADDVWRIDLDGVATSARIKVGSWSNRLKAPVDIWERTFRSHAARPLYARRAWGERER